MKKLLILLFTFFNLNAHSQANSLEITWFGTTSFYISDGTDAIYFDPFITRPSLWKIITFQAIQSDPEIVKKWISQEKRKKIRAIFISHSHYDHILDIGELQKLTRAKVYASETAKNIAHGSGVELSNISFIQEYLTINVGNFEITVLPGEHPAHLWGMTFASGTIKNPIQYPTSVMGYEMGKVYTYLVKHKNGSIFFSASGVPSIDHKKLNTKVDIVIQGIAKSTGYKNLIEKQVLPFEPKIIIPAHHDSFFRQLSEGYKESFFANLKEFKKLSNEKMKNSQVLDLKYGKSFIFQK